MTLVKFNPKPFNRTFNSLLDDFFTELPVFSKNELGKTALVPVNIKETDKDYVLEVVAPGFEKGDFKITLDQQQLTIAAEKKAESKSGNEKQVRREYSYRSFERSFTVDENIDMSAVAAKYENGVLTLNLPKKEDVKAAKQEITIQ